MPDNVPDNANPKDLVGRQKTPLHLIPPVALVHQSLAHKDGNDKYGPYNWRDKKVLAMVYYAAAMRHLLAWFEGEEYAPDSGVHHLAHAAACCNILLDAQAHGCMIDDRPKNGGAAIKLMAEVIEKAKAGQHQYHSKSSTDLRTPRGVQLGMLSWPTQGVCACDNPVEGQKSIDYCGCWCTQCGALIPEPRK